MKHYPEKENLITEKAKTKVVQLSKTVSESGEEIIPEQEILEPTPIPKPSQRKTILQKKQHFLEKENLFQKNQRQKCSPQSSMIQSLIHANLRSQMNCTKIVKCT